MLKKVISGGQSGADIAGLRAAKFCGLQTGGWIPKGFLTLGGSKPEYAQLFGITEHSSPRYPPRTFANVRDSDATMRFAANWKSPGEICTLKAIEQYKRPYFDVDLIHPDPESLNKATVWVLYNEIKILNVAGNTEGTHKGTEYLVLMFMIELIGRVLELGDLE